MIQVPAVLERCAGIDIGKRMVAVAVIVGPADAEGEFEVREYGTTVPQLMDLKEWLLQKGCTSVAMESTGTYWVPVKNVLEGCLSLVLVNARTHRPPKGEKTDFRDARHLAHLHRHGLLKGSYMPPREIVELRDLTRRRKRLQSNLSAEKNPVLQGLRFRAVTEFEDLLIFYTVQGDVLRVVRVLHAKRDVRKILAKERADDEMAN